MMDRIGVARELVKAAKEVEGSDGPRRMVALNMNLLKATDFIQKFIEDYVRDNSSALSPKDIKYLANQISAAIEDAGDSVGRTMDTNPADLGRFITRTIK